MRLCQPTEHHSSNTCLLYTSVDENTLIIIVSQSGETADTLAALRDAKAKGARVLSITNVVGSSIARESDDIFYTWAGPEIAVASTKAYTTQLMAFYMIALNLAMTKGSITEDEYFKKMCIRDRYISCLESIVDKLPKDLEGDILPMKLYLREEWMM